MKRILTVWLVIAFGFLCNAAVPIRAEEQLPSEKRRILKELMQAWNVKSLTQEITELQLEQNMKANRPFIQQWIKEKFPSADQERLEREYLASNDRLFQKLKESYPERIDAGTALEQIYISVYEAYFSEEELREMLGFAQSPTGRKFNRISSPLLQEINQRWYEASTPAFTKLWMELWKEEQKELAARLDKQPNR